MTAWITLFAVAVLFALALRHGQPRIPPLPPGYERERQFAAFVTATAGGAVGIKRFHFLAY